MAIFFLTIADTQLVGQAFLPLDYYDPMKMHHTVMFTDLPTDTHQTISCLGEVDQLNLLVDWLKCDEDEAAYARLKERGLTKPFLP
jgi:hypothetical protein